MFARGKGWDIIKLKNNKAYKGTIFIYKGPGWPKGLGSWIFPYSKMWADVLNKSNKGKVLWEFRGDPMKVGIDY